MLMIANNFMFKLRNVIVCYFKFGDVSNAIFFFRVPVTSYLSGIIKV